jgi:hypothetical protein
MLNNNIKNRTTYPDGNLDPCLWHVHKCGGMRKMNGTPW